jgi:hypothetical protein
MRTTLILARLDSALHAQTHADLSVSPMVTENHVVLAKKNSDPNTH